MSLVKLTMRVLADNN